MADEGRIGRALSGADEFPRAWPNEPQDLSTPQMIAASARVLSRAGLALDVAGHITEVRDDGATMWSTPYGKWWFELCASDMLTVDYDGNVLAGPWDVTPAIFIHTEIHRIRPDARVIIHNHPHYATLLATLHRLPSITDQQACMFDGEVALFNEYTGGIDNPDSGRELAEAIGDASVVLLANHGLLVLADSVPEATYKFEMFERTCRLNAEAWMIQQEVPVVPDDFRKQLKPMLLRYSTTYYWNGVLRRLLAEEPDVLD